MDLEDKDLSSKVIDAAIRVHKSLGPGFLESFYEEALCLELKNSQIPYERQKTVMIFHLGQPIGEHRLDLLVDGKLIVELKAISQLESVHYSILRSYLKATNLQSGLLMNFCSMPLMVKRVGREYFPNHS